MGQNLTTPISAALLLIASHTLAAEQEIPKSNAGDKGRYFLLEVSRKGDVISTLHKRVGPAGTGFTRLETNCATRQVRELGYSEVSPAAIKIQPAAWDDLVPGSSKNDLARFVCSQPG